MSSEPETPSSLWEPTFQDILIARRRIAPYLKPTPLIRPPARAAARGAGVDAQLETLPPIGPFQVRGGVHLRAAMAPAGRARGVVPASTGNHGQSIAYAARLFGTRAVIFAPEHSNPYKVAAMRRLGAELVLTGRDFDEAREAAEQFAADTGMRYVHAANEPLLIAGVGTASLEIIDEVPDIDYIFAPIGAGSCACGASIVAKTVNPRIQVIGVQSERAPVVYLSWRARRLLETPEAATFAEGLATRVAFELPLRILWRLIDEIILVSDEELKGAMRLLLETAHLVAEGAGAASTAGALRLKDRIAGRKVALILTGGNVTLDTLREVLGDESGTAPPGPD